MSEIIAEPVRDPQGQGPEELVQTQGGWAGLRTYMINAADVSLAVTAQGLPRRGDPWGENTPDPDLVCVSCRVRAEAGGPTDPVTGGGISYAEARYETPSLGGRGPVVTDGFRLTNLGTRLGSKVIRYDLADPTPWGEIEEGRGVQVATAYLEAEVFVYTSQLPNLQNIVSKTVTINQDPVALPNIANSGSGVTMDPGQVLYLGAQFGYIEGLVEVRHLLSLAPNHAYAWRRKGGEELAARVYHVSQLGGLW